MLKRVFDIDMERCQCGGKLKFIAVIEQPDVIEKILKHLGLDPQPPPYAPSSARQGAPSAVIPTRMVTGSAVHMPPPEFVRAQIKSVLDDLTVGAVKTGMLANASILSVVAEEMARVPELNPSPMVISVPAGALVIAPPPASVRVRLFPMVIPLAKEMGLEAPNRLRL